MIPYSFNPMGVDSYDDLYWLRKIRDANPTSQLPTLWSEDKDPYTQWEGVTWNTDKRVFILFIRDLNIINLDNINKLSKLAALSCSGNKLEILDLNELNNLTHIDCYSNNLTLLDVHGCIMLQDLYCEYNSLSFLDLNELNKLQYLTCYNNKLLDLNLINADSLKQLSCNSNNLTALPTLASKGLITNYDFTRNNFPTAELDRFRAMGFTDESKLLPQNA